MTLTEEAGVKILFLLNLLKSPAEVKKEELDIISLLLLIFLLIK